MCVDSAYRIILHKSVLRFGWVCIFLASATLLLFLLHFYYLVVFVQLLCDRVSGKPRLLQNFPELLIFVLPLWSTGITGVGPHV